MNYSIAIDKMYTMYIHSLKKLLFVNKIMQKDNTNIAMRILRLEFINKIEGLSHQCCALAYSAQ